MGIEKEEMKFIGRNNKLIWETEGNLDGIEKSILNRKSCSCKNVN